MAQPTLTLQPGVKQRIDGWGVFPSYHHRVEWSDDFHIEGRTAVQQALYRDLGVNLIRVKLSPGYYDGVAADRVNRANIQSLINHLRVARDYGITRYAMAVWSPPAVMKTPAGIEGYVWIDRATGLIAPWRQGIETTADKRTTSLRPDSETAFISYIVNTFKYIQSQGVALPEWFSLQNEPHFSPRYDGCLYPWAQYHRVAIALRQELDRQGLSAVKLTGAETNDYGSADWGSPIFWNDYWALGLDGNGQPNALSRALASISVHSYDEGGYLGTTDPATLDRYTTKFKSVAQRLARDLNYPVMMTEFSIDYAHSMSQIEATLLIARHFNREMMVIPNNYWFWWMGWNRTDQSYPGSQNLLFGDGPTKSKTYHFFSTLWKRVPPGSSSVKGLASSDASWKVDNAHAIDASAFETSTSQVVVLTNILTTPRSVRVQGITKGAVARLYRSTATEDMVLVGEPALSGGALTVTLPARSIVIMETGAASTEVDDITAFTVPASVPAGSGTAGVNVTATTAGSGRTYWAGIYDNAWNLRGSSSGPINPGLNAISLAYSGLNSGPVNFYVNLRNPAFVSLDEVFAQSALGGTPPAAAGLVTNPGFESGTTGWNVYGSVTATTAQRRGGLASLQIGGGNSSNGFEQILNNLTPNSVYTVRLWARGSAAGSVIVFGVTNTSGTDGSRSATLGTGFTEHVFTFVTGPSTTSATLWGWRGNAFSDVQVDDFSVTRN